MDDILDKQSTENLTPDTITQLQTTLGNQFVNRLVQQSQDDMPSDNRNRASQLMLQRYKLPTSLESRANQNPILQRDPEVEESYDPNNPEDGYFPETDYDPENPEDDYFPEDEMNNQVQEVESNISVAKDSVKNDEPPEENPSPKLQQIKNKNELGFKSGIETTYKVGSSSTSIGTNSKDLAHIVSTGKSVKSGTDSSNNEGFWGAIKSLGESAVIKIFTKYLLPGATLIDSIARSTFKYKEMKAYKELSKSKDTDGKTSNASIGKYAFKKTLRGFISRVAKTVLTFVQLVSRLLTMVTGGATALFTEALDVTAGLSKGALKMGRMIKGVFKLIKGTRGKKRTESANVIVDKAFQGDSEMQKLILDANVFGPMWHAKMKVSLGSKNSKGGILQSRNDIMGVFQHYPPTNRSEDYDKCLQFPTSESEVQEYLELMHKYKAIKAVKKQVAESMKSQ